jgi:hypothetical protein
VPISVTEPQPVTSFPTATHGVLIVPEVADGAAKVLGVRIAVRAQRLKDLAPSLPRLLVRCDLIERHRQLAIDPDFRCSDRTGNLFFAGRQTLESPGIGVGGGAAAA